MPTMKEIIDFIIPEVGGAVGDISSGTGTTAVLGGQIDTTGDDNTWKNAYLLMLDAATAADQERIATVWDDSLGTATFLTRADTTYTNETYGLIPRRSYNVQRIRNAINDALRKTRRTIRYYIPTIGDERFYPLDELSWLRSDEDIDAVQLRGSPVLIDNEDFLKWQNGTALAPDGWTLAGSGATVARATTFAARGSYTADLTRSSNDATLTQTVSLQLARAFAGETVTITALGYVRTATGSIARIGISDGLTTSFSSYHSGGSGLEALTATHTMAAGATALDIICSVDTSDGLASFDAVYPVAGTNMPGELTDTGSSRFAERTVNFRTVNAGSIGGRIELAKPAAAAQQLTVVTRRAYATLSTDSASTECPEDLLKAGALYELFSQHRPGEDRERPDRMMAIWGRAYAKLLPMVQDIPVPVPQRAVVMTGA